MASSSSMKMMHGRLLPGLLEEVAHPGGAHADDHLHEVRSADAEEGRLGLARHGLGQQGLARARRAHQQHALRDLPADGQVFARQLEEVHDLLQLLLGLVHAGHVVEGDARLAVRHHVGPRLAQGEQPGPPPPPRRGMISIHRPMKKRAGSTQLKRKALMPAAPSTRAAYSTPAESRRATSWGSSTGWVRQVLAESPALRQGAAHAAPGGPLGRVRGLRGGPVIAEDRCRGGSPPA